MNHNSAEFDGVYSTSDFSIRREQWGGDLPGHFVHVSLIENHHHNQRGFKASLLH